MHSGTQFTDHMNRITSIECQRNRGAFSSGPKLGTVRGHGICIQRGNTVKTTVTRRSMYGRVEEQQEQEGK